MTWDEPKRLSNLDKHGLDMADFEDGFNFETAVQFDASTSRTGRIRLALIGWLNGELVVVAIVFLLGAEALSLVSLRRASIKERERYGFR